MRNPDEGVGVHAKGPEDSLSWFVKSPVKIIRKCFSGDSARARRRPPRILTTEFETNFSRVLVTGASGFIGSRLVQRLSEVLATT